MNPSNNIDPNVEWYYYSIIFARALSLKIKEGEAIVVSVPNEKGLEKEKIIVSHRDGMMHVEPTNRTDLIEGDQFTL